MYLLPNLSLLCITDVQTPQKRELEENNNDVTKTLSMFYAATQRLAEFKEFEPFGKIYDPSKDKTLLDASRSSARVVVAAVGLYAELRVWADSFVPTQEHFSSTKLQSALKELDESVREVNKSGTSVNLQAAWNVAVSKSNLRDPILGTGDDGRRAARPRTETLDESDGTPVSGDSEMQESEAFVKARHDSRTMPPPRKKSIWAQRHFAYKNVFDRLLAEYKEALRHSRARIKSSKSGMPEHKPSLVPVDPLLNVRK